MIFYHGSKKLIQTPIVNGSTSTNDYGPAFYLTTNLQSAKSWACKYDELGVVNKYKVRNESYETFKILDLTKSDKFSVLNWVAILVHFKLVNQLYNGIDKNVLEWLEKYYIDISEYDVVVGYRADDSYWLFPKEFLENKLPIEDLERVYLLGDLGIQHVFISEKAINSLEFSGAIECEEEFLGKHKSIVSKANQIFNEILMQTFDPNKTYLADLMRKDYENR